jgi:hypothetical protein
MDKEFLARVFGRANSEGSVYEGSLRDFALDQTAGKWPNEIVLKGEVEDMRKRDDIIALATIVKRAPAAEYEQRLSQKLDFGAFLTLFAADMILCVWDDDYYASNNYYLYDNPKDGRFVLFTHSPDWIWSARNTFPTSKPQPDLDPFVPLASLKAGVGPGRMAQRLREIPALEARLRAEVRRLLKDVWDVPRLHARLDRATSAVHTTKRTDAKLLSDVASLDKQLLAMKDVVQKQKTYLEALP